VQPVRAFDAGPRRHRYGVWVVLLCLSMSSASAWGFTGAHYDLRLRPDFEQRVLHGHARIRLEAGTDADQVLELPAPTLQIARIRLNGSALAFARTETGWRMMVPRQRDPSIPLWLEVDYRASASEGLVFGDTYVYTAFHTCQWMPCAGSDLSRASFALSLDLPADYRSVASGEHVTDAGRQHLWREKRSFALYTLGFAAGRFTEVVDATGERPLRYLGVDENADQLRAKFRDTGRVMAFFEDKAGVALPHPLYAQVLVPGSVAQEASGFALIGKRALDPILDDPQEDWVIAHEMAHQWWGNLITCATWGEMWLNEGVTVFMTAAWKQHRWGEAAYQRELELARQRWQRAKDIGFDRPLGWAGDYPNLGTRRAIQYSKAALFLGTLRDALGERAFWDGLRLYTRANAGRSVRAADFQAAMEAGAGRSLQPLFDAWVY
jgi:aminopeptidase N